MTKKNYLNESFIEINSDTLLILNKICNELKKCEPVEYFIKNRELIPNKMGIYAFSEKNNFKYIGITKNIKRRFREHTNSPRKGEATWAYLIAKEENKNILEKEKLIPKIQKEKILSLNFSYYLIEDYMTLQLSEIYCVNNLKSYWNTYKTH